MPFTFRAKRADGRAHHARATLKRRAAVAESTANDGDVTAEQIGRSNGVGQRAHSEKSKKCANLKSPCVVVIRVSSPGS